MSEIKINLEKIILEAYGCKNAYEFKKNFDISIQMIKEICVEACRQTLDLAAENAFVSSNYRQGCCMEAGDYFVNKKSILDVINLIE